VGVHDSLHAPAAQRRSVLWAASRPAVADLQEKELFEAENEAQQCGQAPLGGVDEVLVLMRIRRQEELLWKLWKQYCKIDT